ncbi:MAG: hypothetical protein V4450_17150 [Bacteroidota bacterium]
MIAETKTCLSCQQQLRGRSDKKFCNDYCRNTHHNQLNSEGNGYVRNINHCLQKNRRILENIVHASGRMVRSSRQSLLQKGFSFLYFTQCHTTKKGSQSYFCYEYGYRLFGKDHVLVMKRKGNIDS